MMGIDLLPRIQPQFAERQQQVPRDILDAELQRRYRQNFGDHCKGDFLEQGRIVDIRVRRHLPDANELLKAR